MLGTGHVLNTSMAGIDTIFYDCNMRVIMRSNCVRAEQGSLATSWSEKVGLICILEKCLHGTRAKSS